MTYDISGKRKDMLRNLQRTLGGQQEPRSDQNAGLHDSKGPENAHHHWMDRYLQYGSVQVNSTNILLFFYAYHGLKICYNLFTVPPMPLII